MATAWTKSQVTAASGQDEHIDPTRKPGRGMLHIRKSILDFDKIASEAGGSLAVNDTFQAINVNAGETILLAGINVLTAATAAATGDLGFTGGVVDYFVDGIALNDITFPSITTSFDGGMYIASNDTIDLIALGQSPAGGKIEVWALIARI